MFSTDTLKKKRKLNETTESSAATESSFKYIFQQQIDNVSRKKETQEAKRMIEITPLKDKRHLLLFARNYLSIVDVLQNKQTLLGTVDNSGQAYC